MVEVTTIIKENDNQLSDFYFISMSKAQIF